MRLGTAALEFDPKGESERGKKKHREDPVDRASYPVGFGHKGEQHLLGARGNHRGAQNVVDSSNGYFDAVCSGNPTLAWNLVENF